MGVDDSMDIFAVHGLAGVIGLLINAFFGVNYIPALDGLLTGENAIAGGWFNQHWVQLGYQVAYIGATSAYSFIVTGVILIIMNFIPGLQLRVTQDAEREGIDEAELGEFAFDFVEVRRDFDSWNAPNPNLLEGRVRNELEKQEEAANSSSATKYSLENLSNADGEGRTERALENGEIEVEQKAKVL
jgi:Amt family ammonium transporter